MGDTDTEAEASEGAAVAVPESGDGMPETDAAVEASDAEAASGEQSQQPDSDMHKIRCPICQETFTPQGMSGHLRFGHHKTGEEFDELMEKARSGERIEVEVRDSQDSGGESESGAESASDRETRSAPGPQPHAGRSRRPEKREDSFSWERRLDRMEELRSKLDDLYGQFSSLPRLFVTDEGCEEALEALDEIEMQVRERIGASEEDPELREAVDESLDEMEALIRCREQRDTIESKFSGERAERRVQRLDGREAEIRAYIRDEWDVGKPTGALHSDDPVSEIESERESGEGGSESSGRPGDLFS